MKKYWLHVFTLVVYICLVSFGAWHHEPWRDEAHPWLVAKSNSIETIIRNAKYEGTPIFWFATLAPLAKSGLDYRALALWNGILATLAVSLMLFFGNIPFLTKILFLFSYLMAFEYAVIARPYMLNIVVLFSLAALYSKRFTHPLSYAVLVFLLFQTTSFSIVPAGMLTVLFAIQLYTRKHISKRTVAAFFMMPAGAAFVFLQLYPTPFYTGAPTNVLYEFFMMMSQAVVPFSLLFRVNYLFSDSRVLIAIFATCMLIVSAIVMMKENISILLFLLATTGWWAYINGIVHTGNIRHHGLLLIFLLFSWWIFRVDSGKRHTSEQASVEMVFVSVLNIMLVISCLATVKLYQLDYAFPFSGTKDMAQYIKSSVRDSDTIVAFIGSHGEGVLPYLHNRTLWYPEFEQYGSDIFPTMTYIMTVSRMRNRDVLAKVDAHFPSGAPVFLLLSTPLSLEESGAYSLEHESRAVSFWSNKGESLWLYRRSS